MAGNSPTSSNLYGGTILKRGGKFSIDNFTSRVSNNLLIPNTYSLFIPYPKGLPTSLTDGMSENLTLRIDNLELPGKQLATEEVQYYGPPRKSAYGMIYEDLSFNVYLSKNLKERDFFSAWMDLAITYETAYVSYYDDIVKECTFYSYDRSSNQNQIQSTTDKVNKTLGDLSKEEMKSLSNYSVTFEEAYPISIGTITYAYASDEIARLPVTMAYRKWRKTAPKSD
tara:strand:- start:35 stop:712 length:678 start_codon:yes stop_codon:yes gene_type:complete